MNGSTQLRMWRRLAPILIGNIAAPYVIYLVAHASGIADVPALALSAIPPAALTIVTAVRNRRIDVIGALSLAVIAVGIGTSFLTGNGQFAVAKDCLFSLGVGTTALVTLVLRRPLLYHVVRMFRGADDPALMERLERAWQTSPDYRRLLRRYTALWAGGLFVAVAVRLTIAFSLPVGTSLPLVHVVEPVIWISLIVLTRKGMVRHQRSALAATAA